MSKRSLFFLPIMLSLLTWPVLAACGPAQDQAAIVLAGSAQGVNTLIYVYADN